MLSRQFSAAAQVGSLANEVWGVQYLIILRGFAKWTRQEWLSYIYSLQQVVLRPQFYNAVHFLGGCLSMQSY